MAELSARARQILYACITEFVSTGEPVGSRTLSKKHGIDLSAASIRNVLSDLEEWGYLQPAAHLAPGASRPTAPSASSSTPSCARATWRPRTCARSASGSRR